MDFTGIIIFLLGLLSGGLTIWFVRQKGMESLKKNQEEMKQEFENISNKVLLENQNQNRSYEGLFTLYKHCLSVINQPHC